MADPRYLGIGIKQAIDILGLQPSQRTQAQLSKLASFLRNQDGIFSALGHTDAEIVSKWLGYEYIFPGQAVYKQGDFGESMYIVIGGACEFVAPNDASNGQDEAAPHDLLVAGQAFGEAALVALHKPRSRTVVASPAVGGAHLVTLNRSALSNLRFMGAAQPDAQHALQAVLAACCLGVLRQPPGSRSVEDVEVLAEFMKNMEAFRKLPPDMLRRLAADCSHVRLPTGRVLFEEDAPGNSMYVVVSGQCQVRARPLALRQKATSAGGRGLHRPGSLGIGMTMTPRKLHTSGVAGGGGGGGGGFRSMLDSTPRSVVSFTSSSMAGAAMEVTAAPVATTPPPCGGGGDGSVMRYQAGGRVATVLTVRGDRQGQTSSDTRPGAGAAGDEDEETDEEQQRTSAPTLSAAAAAAAAADNGSGSATGNKDSPFWIARFMEDTLKRLHLSDSNAGLGQKMTPLAAVAAAKWRHAAASGRHASGVGGNFNGTAAASGGGGGNLAAAAVDREEEEEGMEALLGRAAARALRQAVSEQRTRKGHNYEADADVDLNEIAIGGGGGGDAVTADGSGGGSRLAATAEAGTAAAPTVQWRASFFVQDSVDSGAAAAAARASSASPVIAPSSVSMPPATVPSVALEDPAKRLLSKIGSRDPANVSHTLLSELVQRADVGVVLYEVAKKLVKRGGGPRRINHTASKKINRVLHCQIRAGPDQLLQGTVQGQKVLGRHSTVATSRNSSQWTKGLAAAALVSGHHRPGSRHGTAAQLGDSHTWGDSQSVQTSQCPRSSFNAAPGTRPGSALTSAVSGYADFDADFGDDLSEVDWNGSDFQSLASFKPSTAASHGNTGRRVTAGDLDHLINTDHLTSAELDSVYGPVIRTITPGQSFGELALLHRDSRRTATVITASRTSANPAPFLDPEQPVDLICITRTTYNHTVRASQVTQLQGLLAFLSRLSPFRGLDDQQRASLAVFCRQLEVAPGAVLAVQGEPSDMLWMVQEGEVVLLDSTAAIVEPLMTRPGAICPPLMRIGSQPLGSIAVGGGAGDGPDGGGSTAAAGVRRLVRQLSAPESGSGAPSAARSLKSMTPALKKESSYGRRVMFVNGTPNHGGSDSGAGAGTGGAGGNSSSSSAAAAAAAAPVDGPLLRYVNPGALQTLGGILTRMGVGGIFGEGLLMTVGSSQLQQLQQKGFTLKAPPPPMHPSSQQPLALQATTAGEDGDAPRGRKGRGRGHAPAVPLPYPCTVVARRATRLLTISASDLSRFADAVSAPLAELAAARAEFLAARMASVSAAKDAVSERVGNMRRMLRIMRVTQDAESRQGVSANLRMTAMEGVTEPAAAATAAADGGGGAGAAAATAASPTGARATVGSASVNPSASPAIDVQGTSQATMPAPSAPPSLPVPPAPGRTAVFDGNVLRLTGATRSLRDLAASWVDSGRSRNSVSGSGNTVLSLSGRKSAQLLPGALLRRLQGRQIGHAAVAAAATAAAAAAAATAAAVADAMRDSSSTSSMPMQPHPAGGRLAAVLYDNTPRLPEMLRDERSGHSLSSATTPNEPSVWALYELGLGVSGAVPLVVGGGGGGAMRCLSTIAEESSGGLLRTIGSSQLVRSLGSVDSGPATAATASVTGSRSSSALLGREQPPSPATADLLDVPDPQNTATTAATSAAAKWITADPRTVPDVGVAYDLPTTADPWFTDGARVAHAAHSISSGGSGRRISSSGGGSGTSEEDEQQEMEERQRHIDMLSAMDSSYDSLGTVEEGDEETALALAALAALRQPSNRPQLPPLRLPSRQVLSPIFSSRPSTSGSAARGSLPQLPQLRLPPGYPATRRRPHSACGLPATDAGALSHVATDFLPPLLLAPPPRQSSPPPSVSSSTVQHLHASVETPTASSSTVQSYYTDISVAVSAGISAAAMAAAAAAAAAVAVGPASARRRPRSASVADGTSRAQTGRSVASGSFGSRSGSDSLVIYTDEGSTSPDLTHVGFEFPEGKRAVWPPVAEASNGTAREGGLRTPLIQPLLLDAAATTHVSDGLAPLLGFPSAVSSVAAAAGPPPLLASRSGSVSRSRSGLDYRPGSRSPSDNGSGGDVVMEAQGASLDRLIAGRPPRPLLRPTASGAACCSGDVSASSSGHSSVRSLGRTPASHPRLPPGGSTAAADLPEPSLLSSHAFATAHLAEAPLAAAGEILPWSNLDGQALSWLPRPPPPSPPTKATATMTATTTATAMATPSDELLTLQSAPPPPAVAAVTVTGEGSSLLLHSLPPLALAAALRRHMVESADGEGLHLSCSPRAARTESPLHSQRHTVSLVDSPVHSPRILSQVY